MDKDFYLEQALQSGQILTGKDGLNSSHQTISNLKGGARTTPRR
ncbi:hypothetical protein THF5G08_180016 [Vibrio jasicida]|nr:hypothetical protein THF5G08_180016 [Vibrio jasicida]